MVKIFVVFYHFWFVKLLMCKFYYVLLIDSNCIGVLVYYCMISFSAFFFNGVVASESGNYMK